jgi:hypothetical protein
MHSCNTYAHVALVYAHCLIAAHLCVALVYASGMAAAYGITVSSMQYMQYITASSTVY